MSTATIQSAVQRYLDNRRQLGFNLSIAGSQLMSFARYADAQGHSGPLTIEIQLDWARMHVRRTGPGTCARRLQILRPFVADYRQFEPSSTVPDPGPSDRVRNGSRHISTPSRRSATCWMRPDG